MVGPSESFAKTVSPATGIGSFSDWSTRPRNTGMSSAFGRSTRSAPPSTGICRGSTRHGGYRPRSFGIALRRYTTDSKVPPDRGHAAGNRMTNREPFTSSMVSPSYLMGRPSIESAVACTQTGRTSPLSKRALPNTSTRLGKTSSPKIKFRASIKADILEVHFTRTGVPRWADGQVNDVLGAGCRDAGSSETR